jgi:hypothetical protein
MREEEMRVERSVQSNMETQVKIPAKRNPKTLTAIGIERNSKHM